MHGRRLATLNEAICIASDESESAIDRLESWTTTHGIDLTIKDVGEQIHESEFQNARETLGISIGGDGTFLEGVRSFGPNRIPLLGINTGTLAFLARTGPRDMDAALTEVLRGRATVHDRQQLQATGAGLDATGVNDVAIQPVPPETPVDRKICRLHVFVDNEYIGEYDGSGIAINTPTGSTGLALSANGPVHFPNDNLTLQITPLNTHTMGVRPLIVSQDAEITVVPENDVRVSVDGGRHHAIAEQEEVLQITGADRPAYIVRTRYDNGFMSALAGKLGWEIRTAEDTGPREYLSDDGDPEDFLAVASRIAREAAVSAGEPVKELHGQIEQVEYKSDKADMVTEADYRSDQIIETVITNEFPNHGFCSEESGVTEGTTEYTWVVDPLDGTGNFAHGNPNYSISISLVDDEARPLVGVVHSPETDEMFHAIRDRGAYRNDTPIAPTDRDRLDESMLLSGYDPDGRFLREFYHATQGVRRLGSAALNLCYVAAGSADALWEYDTCSWDVAAGLCILREAGGRATDQTGQEYAVEFDTETRHPLAASNGTLHETLLDHFPEDGF